MTFTLKIIDNSNFTRPSWAISIFCSMVFHSLPSFLLNCILCLPFDMANILLFTHNDYQNLSILLFGALNLLQNMFCLTSELTNSPILFWPPQIFQLFFP